MIQERLDRLTGYITGIKFTDNYKIAEFFFKKKWIVDLNFGETIQGQLKGENDQGQKHYLFYTSTSIDDLLDTIEIKVIDMNIENEKKDELLKQKVQELQTMFQSQDLDELQKLTFTKEQQAPSVFNRETEEPAGQSVTLGPNDPVMVAHGDVELPPRDIVVESD